MVQGVRIHRHGGPEVLISEEFALQPPRHDEVRIRHTVIAVNFSDINVRNGGFYIATPIVFPLVLGNEASGVIVSMGSGVGRWGVGDRIGYVGSGGPFYENTGSYASERNVPARCLIRLPEHISDRQAAGLMLKGLTASLVVNRVFKPKPGDTVLIHAAASGVGSILVQWSKALGAHVIGTVGSAAKADVARRHGCDEIVHYRDVDFVQAVRRLRPRGVDAVFDGVGRDTVLPSLDCLRPFGILVNYGNASGHPAPLDLLLLAKKGSLSVSRPAFSHHIADPDEARSAATELFDLVARGIVKVDIGQTYALGDAAQAHRDVEARAVAGSAILIP